MSEADDVCVVTHPIGSAAGSHAKTLLRIIESITTVSLVAVWISDDAEFTRQYDVHQIRDGPAESGLSRTAWRFVVNQFRMASVLRRRPESTILFFGTTAYLVPILFARLSGKRVILEPRGNVPLTLQLQWERRMPSIVARLLAGMVRVLERVGYLIATDIITYTPSMAEELGLDPTSERVYPHGARYVDLDRFYPRTPFSERDDIVGYVGRLDEEKGIRELAAIAKGLPDSITFRFIGDGNLRGWLESELAAEIATGQVELIGWVDHDEIPEVLSELKLLVMASEPTEGLPTTILESMACGTPVYATPVSGVPDVITDGETGFLMNSTDAATISDRIAKLLTDDHLETVSRDSVIHITSTFDFDDAIQRYESALR